MASYQKQSSGNWKAIIRRKGYKSQSKTFLSQDEAIEWAETLEQALTGAPSISRSKAAKQTVRGATQLAQYVDEFSAHIPMSTVIEEYLESVQNRLKRPKNEASFWRQLGPYLAKLTLREVTPLRLDKIRDKRLKTCSTTTVRKDMLFISRVFTFCQKKLRINIENPVKVIELPRENKPRERVLSDAELETILSYLPTAMLPIVKLALATGMRRSEIASLRVEFIDLKTRVIKLPDAKAGARDVPLSTEAVEILSIATKALRASDSVFQYKPDSITQAFNRACERASLSDLRFHDLRHTAITRYAIKGLTAPQLQVISGHRTLSQLNRYTNLKAQDVLSLMD